MPINKELNEAVETELALRYYDLTIPRRPCTAYGINCPDDCYQNCQDKPFEKPCNLETITGHYFINEPDESTTSPVKG